MTITAYPLQEIEARLHGYSFLASLFLTEPDHKTISEVQTQLKELLPEGEHLNVVKMTNDDVDDLRQLFYDLFFVPSSGVYVPPFESALKNYQPNKKKSYGNLFAKEATHVQSCYEAVGFVPWEMNIFQPIKDVRFPDHIGFELAFMALLCANEMESYGDEKISSQWETLQYQFLSDHLGKWITNFSLAMKNNQAGFYEKAGLAAENWVLDDLHNLEMKMERKRGEYQ